MATRPYPFDNEQIALDLVMSELDEKSSSLLALISERKCGFELLRFLNATANSLHTIDDIAFYVGKTCAEVEAGLNALEELGFARRLDVTGLVFFGAPSDPAHRRLLSSLCAWQDRWSAFIARLARIDQFLDENYLILGRAALTDGESPLTNLPLDMFTKKPKYVD
jgi:hypothetical protein